MEVVIKEIPMKKYVIAIIGLVLAALVFGSCGEIKTGGTIVVTNGSNVKMLIAVGKLVPSISDATEIADGASKSFSFDKDGLYTIVYIASGSTDPLKSKTEYLSGGETKNVTVP